VHAFFIEEPGRMVFSSEVSACALSMGIQLVGHNPISVYSTCPGQVGFMQAGNAGMNGYVNPGIPPMPCRSWPHFVSSLGQ
jgi:hypothetical protein